MPILPREEYKELAGISGTTLDSRIDAFLPLVDDAIRQYTERDFATTETAETRTYQWDGRGDCNVDDVRNVTDVSLQGRSLTEGTQYIMGPDLEPRFYWVTLPIFDRNRDSAMGFTYNLDVYGVSAPRSFPVDLSVTGTFGYQAADIPGSVKLAAYLGLATTVGSTEIEGGGTLASEAIDSYSRSWDTGQQAVSQGLPLEFLPPRALTLLDPFVRRTGSA